MPVESLISDPLAFGLVSVFALMFLTYFAFEQRSPSAITVTALTWISLFLLFLVPDFLIGFVAMLMASVVVVFAAALLDSV